MPALPSSAARMPPAAPTPTMTTSVFSVAMMDLPSPGGAALQADDGQARERLAALHVGGGEFGLRTRETDQTPASETLVAAVDRIGKQTFHRVGAQRVEEGDGRRPGELAGLALLERRDHLVLLRRREPPERCGKG